MTISESFVAYMRELRRDGKTKKTVKNHECACNSLLRAIPNIPISLLNQRHIAAWKDDMMNRGNKTSSMQRNISCLRGVLDYLHNELDMDVLRPGKVKSVKIKEPHREYLTIPEVKRLLDVIENPRDLAMFTCLFSMGCRISELLNLNRDQVTTDEVTVHGKGDKEYPVFIDDTARKRLDLYFETRKDNLRPVFVSGQGRRITVSRVAQLLHMYSDMAGLDKIVTPHVLRRSHATDLYANGADLYEIKEALGHANISTTQIYVRLPNERKRQVQRKYHSHV